MYKQAAQPAKNSRIIEMAFHDARKAENRYYKPNPTAIVGRELTIAIDPKVSAYMCICKAPVVARYRIDSIQTIKDIRAQERHFHRHRREWCDEMIFSNLVYVIAAFVSYSCGQYFCAVSQFGAAIASAMFHRSHETKYLFVDAVVSSTLAVIFIYFSAHAIRMKWYGVAAFKVLQGILCVFTWLYCGFPGGERYDTWHKRWHYISGCSTLSTSLCLSLYIPEFDLVMHQLAQDIMILRHLIV